MKSISLQGRLRVGVDIGGTFTDFVVLHPGARGDAQAGGRATRRFKLLSTPDDPARAVLEGLSRVAGAGPLAGLEASVVHGSTVATNAVLERKGARTAVVTTRGFRDLLRIGRQARPELYDLSVRRPAPIVPPELSFELGERVDRRGEVLESLQTDELGPLVERLREAGVESVAVSFLFSFLNPEHERRTAARLREAGFFVSASSEVLPEFREYERTSTTALDAFVTPVLARYLGRLERELASAELRIMHSNGGSARAAEAGRHGVRSILSGPAGGVVGALHVARRAGFESAITFDMGGTSTDVSLAPGEVRLTAEGEIDGLPVRVPQVDLHTVGSGGGSIARVDPGGALRVGPESAGADPGPACYGRGGTEATVTDAHVVLGRLPPDRFLGGEKELDPAAATAALARLAEAVGIEGSGDLTPAEVVALGVLRVAEARMERALRRISVERGHDPADFTLVSFGGAGGLHACRLARGLGIRRVVVPPAASTLSALGMLVAPVVRDDVRTVMLGGDVPLEELERRVGPMAERLREEVLREGVAPGAVRVDREVEVRYVGQSYELAVPLKRRFVERFHREHHRAYGHADPGAPVEVVSLRVRATGEVQPLPDERLELAGPDPAEAFLGRRALVDAGEAGRDGEGPRGTGNRGGAGDPAAGRRAEVPHYAGERLRPGNRIAGPAVVVQPDTTVYLPPGDVAEVDPRGNLVVSVGGAGAEGDAGAEGYAGVDGGAGADGSAAPGHGGRRTAAAGGGGPVAAGGDPVSEPRPDPVRLEVFKHLFGSVAEEMGGVLRRTAFSPNIKERRDYSCALFDPAARMVAQAAHIPVHLGAMPLSVRRCVEELELEPGDVAILNDPFRGGTHLPDITLVTPVHVGHDGRRRLLGFAASRAHHADVGGAEPGSMGLARELVQEGIVIPPVKLVENGEPVRGVRELILANVRTPEEREGDLRAQLAAVRKGAERLTALAARYGPDELARRMDELLEYAERMVRALLAEIPDGTYRFEDRMDDDGVTEEPAEIRVAVHVRGDEATVDFTGTSDQRAGGINAVHAITVSACFYAFRCLMGLDVPSNSGCLEPIRVVAPEGTLVNARWPAAVAGGNVETSQRIVDVLLGALARACPERVPAASQGTMNNLTVGGRDPDGGRAFAYYETVGGGAGAGPGFQGADAVHTHMTNTLNTPVEALEFAYPLRVRRYEVRRGSGGRGARRGGEGIRRDLEILVPARVSLLTERRRFPPYGLAGGRPGAVGRNLLLRDGEERELPGKGSFAARPGDVVSLRTPGGGGHGSPA